MKIQHIVIIILEYNYILIFIAGEAGGFHPCHHYIAEKTVMM